MTVIGYVAIAFFSGASMVSFLGWLCGSFWARKYKAKLNKKAEKLLQEMLSESEKKRSEAKKILERHKLEVEKKYTQLQSELQEKEDQLKQSTQELVTKKESLEDMFLEAHRQESELARKKNNLENLRQLYRRRLFQVAHITEIEARKYIKEEVMYECEEEVRRIRQEILGKSTLEIEQEANRILVDTMQRLGGTPSICNSAALIKLPSEDIKGRLIGKEGRNIKCFETTTGVTLIVDETPGTVLVSSFDPVRREVAKLALETLIQDGRIHPATIEEAVKESEKIIDKEIYKYGEKAIIKLELKNVHSEVVPLIGKLQYRLSNNQNTLEHSIEVAQLAGMIAAELGLDESIAKRCGLFHDMGKAINSDLGGSHARIAAELLRRHGEHEWVVNAVASSHQEVPSASIYAEVLKLADAVSATRPGARLDSSDGYVQRIRSLEQIVGKFVGIKDAYAIQAGREIRVVACPEFYDDLQASVLATKIRKKIEDDLIYPGNIKVTIIRERRFVETAS